MLPAPIAPLTQASDTLLLTTSPTLLKSWSVGEVLAATVLEVTVDGSALLQIGAQRVRAETQQPFLPGERLSLKVISLGDQPVLARLNDPAATPASGDADLRQDALKQVLPRQAPLPPLLSQLVEIALGKMGPASVLPREVTAIVARLVGALPTPEQVAQPQTFKEALQSSGMFLESRLADTTDATPGASVQGDLKAGLLRLAAALVALIQDPAAASVSRERVQAAVQRPEAPPSAPPATAPPAPPLPAEETAMALARHVEQALARIELNQLNAAAVDQTHSPATWTLELPVRDRHQIDLFELRVEEGEGRRRGAKSKTWSVTIATDFDALGPLYARVMLNDQRLHTMLWAERPETVSLIKSHQTWLQARLRGAGLDAQDIVCAQGRPAQPLPPASVPLIDTTV